MVYGVQRGDQLAAMKLLKQGNDGDKRFLRFKDEVNAMRLCSDIQGVLPVFDASLEPMDEFSPWFVMGLAVSVAAELSNHPNVRRVVQAIESIALVLKSMHARGISHRDIKPENLFFYEGRWSVGDFGLAAFDGKAAMTARGERIGPLLYIAPEMLNDADGADGKPADVFSLAKTLWVLTTGQKYPYPGEYDTSYTMLHISNYVVEERTNELDQLIAQATKLMPTKRPSMSEFASELSAWLAPRPKVEGSVSFDLSHFAAELERRKSVLDAKASVQKRSSDQASAVGHRLRELLRPTARDIELALKQQSFQSVSLSIDNMQWGFDLVAVVPDEKENHAHIRLYVGVDSIEDSRVKMTAKISVERFSPARVETLLWSSALEFLEGGSQESILIEKLKSDIYAEIQAAVPKALSLVLGDAIRVVLDVLTIRDSNGQPVQGAEVMRISADGISERAVSGSDGSVVFPASALETATAFVAHKGFRGHIVDLTSSSHNIVLADSTAGSQIFTDEWSTIEGLAGSVSLIHDSESRTYAYANNVAIDGGLTQPVAVAVGKTTTLRGKDGKIVSLEIRAFHGPFFLADVSRMQSSTD